MSVVLVCTCHSRSDLYLQGQSKDFDDLVDQFNPRKVGGSATSSSQLRLWILALSHVLSRLEKRHASLVEAIVNLPWTTMDTAFVKSYTVFIGMLLSARPEYLSLVLCKIAQGFTYRTPLPSTLLESTTDLLAS